MIRLLALALVLPAFAAPAPRYPIDPVGLRSLVHAADLVVVARVDDTSERDVQARQFFDSSEAVLKVIRPLKGHLSEGDHVSVVYAPNMGCPSPARYPEGGVVLAFLYHWKDDPAGLYRTVALSYGSKELDGEELKVYVARIRELLALDAETDEATRRAGLNAWITSVLVHPATRGEALIDIGRKEAFVRKNGELPLSVKALSPEQIDRLLEAVRSDATCDWNWSRLVQRLGEVTGTRLDRVLLEKLWNFSGSQQGSTTYEVMALLASRRSDAELKALARSVGKMPSYGATEEQEAEKHRLVTRFLGEYAARHPFFGEQ